MGLQKPAMAAPAIAGSDPRIKERLGGCSVKSSSTPHNSAKDQNRLRLQLLAGRLHALGPKPLFYFLEEIERGADLRSHLEEYSRLPADFIKAYGGDVFPPSVHVIVGEGVEG